MFLLASVSRTITIFFFKRNFLKIKTFCNGNTLLNLSPQSLVSLTKFMIGLTLDV